MPPETSSVTDHELTLDGNTLRYKATAGNLLIYGNLTTSKTVNNGDAAPSFPAASLQFQIDN